MGFFKKNTLPVPGRRSENGEQGRVRPTPSELSSRYAFRRNRTLTGSLASNVESVNEHGAELKSARVHTHRLRRHRRHAGAALFVVLALAAGLSYLIFQSIITTDITTSAPKHVDKTPYSQAVHDYLAKHPLERFRFSLSVTGLASYLQAHGYPEVDAINNAVSSDGFGSASIHINFRNPVVVWRTGGAAVYVDAKGNTFSRSYYQDPSVQIVDQTGIPTQDNQVLASNKFLGFIGKVIGRMKDNGYTVTQIILPASTTRQVQVTVGGTAYPIKFSIDRPVGEQAEDAARAIRHLASKGISAQYIDVRVSGRVYYQ